MNTMDIYLGLIPDDIHPQAMIQEGLDCYLHKRTGINACFFELSRLQQYKRKRLIGSSTCTTPESTLEKM
jgi:hypothetical protein